MFSWDYFDINTHKSVFVRPICHTKVVSWQRICVYYKVVSWKQFCVYLYQSGLMKTYLCVSIQKWSHDNVFVCITKWSIENNFVCIYTKVVSWQRICLNRYNSGLMKTYLCVSVPKWPQENIQNVYLYQSSLLSKNFSISIPE
jgi:hypothetical protein